MATIRDSDTIGTRSDVPLAPNAVRTAINQDQVTGRADWLHGANSTIFARFTYTRQNSLQGGLMPLQGTGNNSASTNAISSC